MPFSILRRWGGTITTSDWKEELRRKIENVRVKVSTPEELMELRRKLEQAWCRRTAHPKCRKKWRKTLPSFGQCYVTALITQDHFGGELLAGIGGIAGQKPRGKKAGDLILMMHIWNRLPDGTEVDLTADQMGGKVPIPVVAIGKITKIGAKRSNPRYKLLRRRLEALR